MGTISTVGRYLFALVILVFGVFHFMNTTQLAGYVPIPPEEIWVYLTGVAHILAAIAIMIGKFDALAAFLLGVMLLIYAFAVHAPAIAPDNNQMGDMLKAIAMGGGAWMYIAIARDRTGYMFG